MERILVCLSLSSGNGKDVEDELKIVINKFDRHAYFEKISRPTQIHTLINKYRPDVLVVYGGDGTVVEALKLLANKPTKLLVIPGGTGNFIAKHFNIAPSPTELLNKYFLNEYAIHHFDLAHTQDGLLGLDIHVGWWAEATLDTPRTLKKKFGLLAYAIQTIKKLPKQKKRRYVFELDDGKKREVYAYTSLFANKAIQNFFGFRLFNKRERPSTLELAFIQSLNPLYIGLWIVGRFVTGRNIGPFIKIYYAYKVSIFSSPTSVLFDDRERIITHPYSIQAGNSVTKLIVPENKSYETITQKFRAIISHVIYVSVEHVRNTIAGAPLYRYSQVMPRLYVGGAIRYKAIKEFRSWNVKSIVNMRTSKDPNFGKDIDILQLATIDMHAPSLENLEKGVKFIKNTIQRGDSVYVHCRHGRGRGPTMVAAYLIAHHSMTTNQAIKYLKNVRPMTEILSGQRKRLIEYEKYISQH